MKKKRNSERASLKIKNGVISTTGKGLGFVTIDGYDEDVMIQPEHVNCALNGDTVEAEVLQRRGKRVEGRITRVVTRKKNEFVGTIVRVAEAPLFELIPDDNKCYVHIDITNSDFAGLDNGVKAMVKMDKWDNPARTPTGKVVRIFGLSGSHSAEMGAIIADAGFNETFPLDIVTEAKKLKSDFEADLNTERTNRRDFSDVLTFTIDPEDAKDFDDALSFRELSDSEYEVGIHIADVSHFVRPGTLLDDEAYRRATSVYLVDRTIPMLPEELSIDICSLKPNVPRLTFSAVFKITRGAVVKDAWFGRTIIRSDKRFTYEEAQQLLDDPTKDMTFGHPLVTLNALAKVLNEHKIGRAHV